MPKFIESKNIDKKKWDAKIEAYPLDNIFMYSWYLDAVSDYWGAYADEEYETIFPVTFTKKLKIKQFTQALFTREYDIIGEGFNFEDVYEYLDQNFSLIQFRNRNENFLKLCTERKHQWIDLTKDFISNYSENAKRLIKKSDQNFQYKISEEIDSLFEIIQTFVAPKLKEMNSANLNKLKKLMLAAIKNKKGFVCETLNEKNEVVAAGFFMLDKKRITYLKGGFDETYKKSGPMYGLMNYIFVTYKHKYEVFDFGGSDVENVRNFNLKLGASDRIYYNFEENNLPKWFELAKKIK